MFLAATVDLGPIPPNLAAYVEHHVARNTVFEYSQGAEVYELVDPAGRAYIMQAYSQQRDAALTESDLPTLATNNHGLTVQAIDVSAYGMIFNPGSSAVHLTGTGSCWLGAGVNASITASVYLDNGCYFWGTVTTRASLMSPCSMSELAAFSASAVLDQRPSTTRYIVVPSSR